MTIYEILSKYDDEYKIDKIRNERFDDLSDLNVEEHKTLEALVNLVGLHENYKEKDSNNVFQPWQRWEGYRSFSLEDMEETDWQVLLEVDFNKLPIVISTRIYDVLWVARNDYKAAIKACEAYLFLFSKIYDNNSWVECVNLISRALCIAAQLGKKNYLYNKVCEEIKACLIKEDGNDPLFLSIELLERLLEQKYGSYSDYIEISDRIINNAIEHNHLENKVEAAFRVKRQLLMWGKQSTHNCDMSLVSYYEKEADKENDVINDLFIAIRAIEKAIHLARSCKETQHANDLLRKLDVLQKKLPDKMTKISNTIDLKVPHDQIIKLFDGTEFVEDILTIIQLVRIYKVEELRKMVTEEGSFVSGMFGVSLLDSQGHTVAAIPPLHGNESNEQIVELHMLRKLDEIIGFNGKTVLLWGLQELNKKHDFDESDLQFIFDECAIVRPGREKILAFGMNMALHGRLYEALHILAPQAENIFRYIAEENGGLVYTLEDDNTSNARTLSSIFDIPELIDCYDPDYLFTFRGLLNEKAGSNLRNLIAHGILDPSSVGGSAAYFCMALLKICISVSHGFFKKYESIGE